MTLTPCRCWRFNRTAVVEHEEFAGLGDVSAGGVREIVGLGGGHVGAVSRRGLLSSGCIAGGHVAEGAGVAEAPGFLGAVGGDGDDFVAVGTFGVGHFVDVFSAGDDGDEDSVAGVVPGGVTVVGEVAFGGGVGHDGFGILDTFGVEGADVKLVVVVD